MPSLADLPTPALVLDLDKLEANIDGMAAKCDRLGVALRPHIKTHKSPRIAALQLARGAQGITVSTLYEARRFADAGFADITWAYPIPLSRISGAVELSRKVTLRLVADSAEAVTALEQTDAPLKVLMKVDCGYHRAGVDPEAPAAVELASRIAQSKNLAFEGIVTHSGHAYHAGGPEELAAIAETERSVMAAFAERLRASGLEVPIVSVGSTPAMSTVRNLEGVTEARPGNYAFYDGMQVDLGACAVGDCAISVLTSVISSSSDHSIVDAGALALSKDLGSSSSADPNYGSVFADYDAVQLEPDLKLTGLSQEHGHLNAARPVGTRLRVLAQHSCLTVAQFDHYVVARDDQVVDEWPVLRGRD